MAADRAFETRHDAAAVSLTREMESMVKERMGALELSATKGDWRLIPYL